MANLPPPRSKNVYYGCFCCVRTSSSLSRHSRATPRASADANGKLDNPSAKHLIIMVNGIVGSASNWKFAADQFQSRFGREVLVHCSARNAASLTFDGVDVMGHRLAEEVKEIIEELPGLKRISFVAHSLGGLVARYAIGQLYSLPKSSSPSKEYEEETPGPDPSHGTILGLQPVNFVTVATPHIGSRGNWQLPFLCGLTFLEKVAVFSAHWFVGRTGRHLFLTDGDESQSPLLQRMVSDCPEGQFISALQAFQRRVAYANMNFDHMVGWRTATIRRECEMPQLKGEPIDSKYPHIVHVEDVVPDANEPSGVRKPALDPIEEEMISGLRQLSWQRVDVSFSGSPQKLSAHNTIQVKYYWMHSEGADVITHIIDNFVLY